MVNGVGAEFCYDGGIVIWCNCGCCGVELTKKINDVDDLLYSSLESIAENMLLDAKWDRWNCLCPKCKGDACN